LYSEIRIHEKGGREKRKEENALERKGEGDLRAVTRF